MPDLISLSYLIHKGVGFLLKTSIGLGDFSSTIFLLVFFLQQLSIFFLSSPSELGSFSLTDSANFPPQSLN